MQHMLKIDDFIGTFILKIFHMNLGLIETQRHQYFCCDISGKRPINQNTNDSDWISN